MFDESAAGSFNYKDEGYGLIRAIRSNIQPEYDLNMPQRVIRVGSFGPKNSHGIHPEFGLMIDISIAQGVITIAGEVTPSKSMEIYGHECTRIECQWDGSVCKGVK